MKVCVVGAGPCGLTTIKQLRDEGHDVVCFDRNVDLGGLWLRHDDPQTDAGEMKAYDTLMLTISMKLMAYSDHPFGDGRVFYTRAQYLEYLRGYADRFGLAESIRYGTEVNDIRRDGRSWTVAITRDGAASSETFDAVAVCSGPFMTPNREIPGLEGFTGEVVHSSEYRNSDRCAGKRVLVVGLAESGADLVREIGDVATECTLAIRSYTYLLPRVFNRTRTTDNGTVRAHAHEMCRRSADHPFVLDTVWGRSPLGKGVFLMMSVVLGMFTTAAGVVRALAGRAPGGRRAVVPAVNPLGQPMEPAKIDIDTLDNAANWDMIRTWNRRSHPDGSWAQRAIFCKNVSFVPSIVDGRVALNDSGIAGSDCSTVRFRDGSSGQFDVVVLCTGFTTEKLSIGDLRVKDGNVRNLYKHFLHPEHDGTAAFIGFVRPFSGGIPICAEMQARYFARLCSGKLLLPSNIDERIGREKEWEEYWTALSPRHTEAIPSQVLYLDALAREIGCLVPAWRMMLNPKLFIQLWFGSFNQSCYRIVGPHKLGKAALEDLYSETVENRWQMAGKLALLQLMPARVHPKHLI
ncbi:flavin-containing monooxygenase [Gordonia aichiensis]|uniref:Putative flavin-containing monooxygenase n=1 Tax=Gordonia aichiensis NBRC 108223 TaxID=1220583 RepID=L7KKW0_9ACTN|nr:NAD(P)-binding domain-containing protein [Gordonia aichiensis]GAC49254.1 putative flavin-containing monooxygenase [Gordonia aichiensis NBRC 108223]